jgi:hypothetical protein
MLPLLLLLLFFFYDAQLVAFVISTSHSTLEKTHFFSPTFFFVSLSRFLLATKTGFKREREKNKTIINTSRDLFKFSFVFSLGYREEEKKKKQPPIMVEKQGISL